MPPADHPDQGWLIGSRWIAAISVISITAIAALARPAEWFVASVVIIAMVWGAAPQAIDAFCGRQQTSVARPTSPGTVTVVMHVDGQPSEVSRASATATAAEVPTIVVTTDERTAHDLDGVHVPVIVQRTLEHALNRAVSTMDTDAFIIVTAGSFVDVSAARWAAGAVRDGAGWVIGRSKSFNRDAYGPTAKAQLQPRLRGSGRSGGVVVWEPDATVVSTQLARARAFEPHRPWGAMLRAAAADGSVGGTDDAVLTITAEPVGADWYWPASVLRHRRAVADLADAVHVQRNRPRWLVLGLLLRELGGMTLALWLLMPWLLSTRDQFAFRCAPPVLLVLWMVPVALRWFGERRVHHVPLHPVDDLVSLAFDAPGSVLALPTAVTRRVTPTRLRFPKQPLMLACVGFAAITLVPLFSEGTTASRRTAAGLALTELALLFMLSMRAVFQWRWARIAYRVPARLPVWIDGTPATSIDMSPSGLAVEGHVAALPLGSDLAVRIELGDGSMLSGRGTVVTRRSHGAADVAGISLRFPQRDQQRWNVHLARVAAASVATPPQPRPPVPVADRIASSVVTALVAIVAVVAATALSLTVIGYRPLIIRSASMEPALRVGDVILVEDIRADQLSVGDIATIGRDVTQSDSLTHRVRVTTVDGDIATITTQGDANSSTETFHLRADEIVGRVVWRVPQVGASLAWAGTKVARAAVAALGACIAVVVVLRAWRPTRARAGSSRRTRRRARDDR